MRLRRCAVLFLEPRESVAFELESLLSGGDGLRRRREWLAKAPHLETDVPVDTADREALGSISPSAWLDFQSVLAVASRTTLEGLLAKGLLIGDGPDHAAHRERDQVIRDTHWEPLSALAQVRSRWQGADSEQGSRDLGLATFADMVDRLGQPPPHLYSRGEAGTRIVLAPPRRTAIDELLGRRVTCRNWDLERPLDTATIADLMHRVHAAQAVHQAAPTASVLKKTSPSGGSLHPTEAYLLVRHVEGVVPGLYHYHAGEHALEPLPWPDALATSLVARQRAARGEPPQEGAISPGDDAALRDFASALLAGQHWFGDAHVLVFMTSRFRRHTWKYRHHAKALRVLLLDVGHLSQTLYLSATEFGLGAFITGAVNDVEIEQALGIDPLQEGVMAVNGFGWRGDTRGTVEFDPLRKVWGDWGTAERAGNGK
ncbi:MAG TPA: putative peptide maturation dehydrogenase [Xanthomonadaceae bacterium]|nr:putative peptide maturation dehydrogenase [Xanthomonadaceae bacterium]